MANRTGLRTLRTIAHKICRLVATFTPLLQATFGTNIPLILALEAMNTACGTFVEQADNELATGA